jgi:hypothetical protein
MLLSEPAGSSSGRRQMHTGTLPPNTSERYSSADADEVDAAPWSRESYDDDACCSRRPGLAPPAELEARMQCVGAVASVRHQRGASYTTIWQKGSPKQLLLCIALYAVIAFFVFILPCLITTTLLASDTARAFGQPHQAAKERYTRTVFSLPAEYPVTSPYMLALSHPSLSLNHQDSCQ